MLTVNTVCNKNVNKQIMNSSRRIIAFLLGITILNRKIKIVTEFPCLLGHSVCAVHDNQSINLENLKNFFFAYYKFI